MSYIGKKPVDFNDVTEAQTFSVTGDLTVDTNTLFVDASANAVGIGTSIPTSFDAAGDNLVIGTGSGNNGMTVYSGSSNAGSLFFADGTSTAAQKADGYIQYEHNNQALAFASGGGSEAMRLNSSGDLFVSKTSQNVDTDGHELRADGVTVHTAPDASVLFLNRRNSDGAIATFMRSGTTVGSIGADIGTISIDGGSTAAGILSWSGSRRFRWIDSFYPDNDNLNDLGLSSRRFDDIFATNGTIQTSDQNEKQQIASLTDAEMTAAKAISKLFKTFKWSDKVEAKGDAARTHAGVIAQEVQQAMSDAGLNAADYAFWCSDTWWESGDEFYKTQADAPEGATERTRLGIRYPELLAFVGAATEQRLTHLETLEARIVALENT